jgi:hypothetical protein
MIAHGGRPCVRGIIGKQGRGRAIKVRVSSHLTPHPLFGRVRTNGEKKRGTVRTNSAKLSQVRSTAATGSLRGGRHLLELWALRRQQLFGSFRWMEKDEENECREKTDNTRDEE